MRIAKLIPLLSTVAALAPGGFARERTAPLDPIAGFELRLLDKKFPVQITADKKTEVHRAPVWVFMPEAGRAQAPLDDITQPADLDGGTTLLPAPPDGFGLRALKLPIRESFILADGRQAIVEIPVFVYFRRVGVQAQLSDLPADSLTVAIPVADPNRIATPAPAGEARTEPDQFRNELAGIYRQFFALAAIMDDSPARARLEILVRQLGNIVAAHDVRAGYTPDISLITTPNHDPKLSL
jgi:hypothetical protein